MLSLRPIKYNVSLKSVANDDVHACSYLAHEDAENTTLILNCIKIIKPIQLYRINILGTNPAGTSIIVQDTELSKQTLLSIHYTITNDHVITRLGTHYVQDINATGSPGHLNISCEFVVDNKTTLGYVALVHSQADDDVNYLVTENSNQGIVTNHLSGLRSKGYTTLLFAINETGLPLQQAAGFPTDVSINGNFNEQIEGTLLYCLEYG